MIVGRHWKNTCRCKFKRLGQLIKLCDIANATSRILPFELLVESLIPGADVLPVKTKRAVDNQLPILRQDRCRVSEKKFDQCLIDNVQGICAVTDAYIRKWLARMRKIKFNR